MANIQNANSLKRSQESLTLIMRQLQDEERLTKDEVESLGEHLSLPDFRSSRSDRVQNDSLRSIGGKVLERHRILRTHRLVRDVGYRGLLIVATGHDDKDPVPLLELLRLKAIAAQADKKGVPRSNVVNEYIATDLLWLNSPVRKVPTTRLDQLHARQQRDGLATDVRQGPVPRDHVTVRSGVTEGVTTDHESSVRENTEPVSRPERSEAEERAIDGIEWAREHFEDLLPESEFELPLQELAKRIHTLAGSPGPWSGSAVKFDPIERIRRRLSNETNKRIAEYEKTRPLTVKTWFKQIEKRVREVETATVGLDRVSTEDIEKHAALAAQLADAVQLDFLGRVALHGATNPRPQDATLTAVRRESLLLVANALETKFGSLNIAFEQLSDAEASVARKMLIGVLDEDGELVPQQHIDLIKLVSPTEEAALSNTVYALLAKISHMTEQRH